MTPVEELAVRQECALIAAAECGYWAAIDSPSMTVELMSYGGMGAAANICGAILLGRTAEQHKREIAARGLPASDTAVADAAATTKDPEGME